MLGVVVETLAVFVMERPAKEEVLVDVAGEFIVIELEASVTWVCANARPSSTAPVCMIICFALNIVPFKVEYVPSVAPVTPPTCQKTFDAWAPPASITLTPAGTLPAEAMFKSPAIWNSQTSFEPPESVTLVGIVTSVLHL